jgi:hypothetical protein
VEGIEFCDILFVGEGEEENLPLIFSRVQGHGVLTVSEIQGFAERGGIIRLFEEDKRLRFEINPGVAEQEGLRLSARLLKLARIVGPPPGPEGRRPTQMGGEG